MRFISYTTAEHGARPGLLDDEDQVIDLRSHGPANIADLVDFIGQATTDGPIAATPGATRLSLPQVNLLAPIPRPRKNVFCVGRNYKAHVEEGHRARGSDVAYPPAPQFFTKAPTSVIGPGAATIIDPAVSTKIDYEAELGVVIGRGGKDISEADALAAIFGYTIVNDFTARDLQGHHGQWFKGKSLDRSCGLGPWIVPAAEVGDPQDLTVELRVNGVLRQSSHTSQMIFPIARIIHELSRGMTLEPGDIIATGTPEGVGYAMDPPCFLQHGDTVTIEIQKIGRLVNLVEDVSKKLE